MNIFKNFYSYDNLKKAFHYLEQEFNSTSLAIDPIWAPGFESVKNNTKNIISMISDQLKNQQYEPNICEFFYSSKPSLGIRPISILSIIDRIVYQAIFNPDILGNILESKINKNCYYPKISKQDITYLSYYKAYWQKFIRSQVEAFSHGYVYYIEFDIDSFFDNIYLPKLIELIKKDLPKNYEKIINILEKQLTKWSVKPNFGIPQGSEVSNLLSNYLLSKIADNKIKSDEDIKYFRYQDDIILMAKSSSTLKKNLEIISKELFHYHLDLNNKTKLKKITSVDEIKNMGFSEYGEYIIPDCENEIPRILKKIDQYSSIDKKELSTLKFWLKSDSDRFIYWNDGSIFGINNTIKLLAKNYSKLPSLAEGISNYIQAYINQDSIYNLLKENLLEKHLFTWQKFWILKNILSSNLFPSDIKKENILDLIKNDPDWKIRILYFYYKSIIEKSMVNLEKIKRFFKASDSIFEKHQILYSIKYSISDELYNDLVKELNIKNDNELSLILNTPILESNKSDIFLKEYNEKGIKFFLEVNRTELFKDLTGINTKKKEKEAIRQKYVKDKMLCWLEFENEISSNLILFWKNKKYLLHKFKLESFPEIITRKLIANSGKNVDFKDLHLTRPLTEILRDSIGKELKPLFSVRVIKKTTAILNRYVPYNKIPKTVDIKKVEEYIKNLTEIK